MTFTFNKKSNENYSVSIEQEKFSNTFKVVLAERFGEDLARTLKVYYYDTRAKANRRFNQLVKEYL